MYHDYNADFEKKEKEQKKKKINVENVIYKDQQNQKVNNVIQKLVKKLKLLIQKQLIQVNWQKLKMNLLTIHII